MIYFKILFLILNFASNANNICFIAYKNGQIIHKEGNCNKRYTPASTFKIALSLMGFDSGILIDSKRPTWKFKTGYVNWLEHWKQTHNPKSWFSKSCVWYSQIITKKTWLQALWQIYKKIQLRKSRYIRR